MENIDILVYSLDLGNRLNISLSLAIYKLDTL